MPDIGKENLNKPIQFLKSIGPKRAESFNKIGIETVRDLIFYFPSRHLDRSNILNSIQVYKYVLDGFQGEVTILASVDSSESKNFGRKELFKVQFKDESGYFDCVWFHSTKYFSKLFEEGDAYAISGKPVISKYGHLQFTHPDFDKLTEEESGSFLHTGKIIPFYKVPKELKEKNIGDLGLRKLISSTVKENYQYIEETLPEEVQQKYSLLGLKEAVLNYHFPESGDLLQKSIHRMKYEEIFYLEVLLALKRQSYRIKNTGNSLALKSKLVHTFINSLPFKLTEGQLHVLTEIKNDLKSSAPMNRLLQGDVGSGKTIVAIISMLIAIDNGFQAVLMAPTEILADQHAKNISEMMRRLKEIFPEKEIKVTSITGGQKKSAKEKNIRDVLLNESDIIVGTHALFEERVEFHNLGLVIIDEQHRFGVAQRAKLQFKGVTPDVLIMSATPIPRTLSMTLYGDLDVSVIKELPHGRKKIKTLLRGESALPDIYKFIIDKRKEGYQSFIVYPLVEESEKVELKAAEKYYLELKESYLKELKVGLIHGRMSWQEKEEMMYLFKAKEYDVLISTSVIEVGIDIPDANIMLINDAFQFGLSQLHQLRGRIGRGSMQAYCILVTKDEFIKYSINEINPDYLSPTQLERYKAIIRLQSMVKHTDGFKIAEIDMKLRGPGNIFSTSQSGFPEFKFINIVEDQEIITMAKKDAFEIISKDPHLKKDSNKIIRQNLNTIHSFKFMLSQIA